MSTGAKVIRLVLHGILQQHVGVWGLRFSSPGTDRSNILPLFSLGHGVSPSAFPRVYSWSHGRFFLPVLPLGCLVLGGGTHRFWCASLTHWYAITTSLGRMWSFVKTFGGSVAYPKQLRLEYSLQAHSPNPVVVFRLVEGYILVVDPSNNHVFSTPIHILPSKEESSTNGSALGQIPPSPYPFRATKCT